MYVESACFDPNTIQEGLSEDGFSQTIPNCNPNFSMEELPYHQNPSQVEAAGAMEMELQQQLGLNYNPSNSTLTDAQLMQEMVNNSNPNPVLPYDDQSNWVHEMSYTQHPNHPNLINNNSSLPDLLNLFNLPRFSPSSVLSNSSLAFMNQPPRSTNLPGFLADLSSAESGSASNVVYDPLLPLNLPPHPPLFKDLFQSLPQGYTSLPGPRANSLFGGLDERDQRDGGLFENGDGRNFDNGVLEFTRDINCLVKVGKSGKKHFATEKHRREQFNDKFQALKKLVPNPTKPDRASIVGDAIGYIEELLRTVNELKILVEKKRCERERNKRLKTEQEEDGGGDHAESSCLIKPEAADESYINGPSSSLRSSWLQRKSKETEVDVRIIDDEVTIKLAQRKKINCLFIVSKVLDELQLDIHHVAGGLVGDNFSFLFNTKICEGSCVYASAIANKLIDVVDRQYAAIPPTTSY